MHVFSFISYFCSLKISKYIPNEDFGKVERFVILMYDKRGECYDVNVCRKEQCRKVFAYIRF